MIHGWMIRIICAWGAALPAFAQADPGPRGGAASAGGYYEELSAGERQSFASALAAFTEVDSVSGTLPGEPGSGLGPSFNGNSCGMCHRQPAIGGSSPGLRSKQAPTPNPQVALATLDGATNTVPSFITSGGPIREARFIRLPGQTNGGLDGGVHGLYTVQGRIDAPGCRLAQPDFAQQMAAKNVSLRIPTPVFGLGLVEGTPDATLAANLSANQAAKSALGIGGRLNTSGNDGTVTRFGWKAQNKSLLVFAAEAYNVEQGVSNEMFPNQRSDVSGCVFNATPEDHTGLASSALDAGDIVRFAIFMRLSAPPVPATSFASEINGQTLFADIGCALCHSPSLTSGSSPYSGMSYATYHPYSDFALHHMGANLADGILQGAAGADDFRTALLWGVGQRLFFLHDGRTSDLLQAIEAHMSPGRDCVSAGGQSKPAGTTGQECASEANAVIARFHALATSQKQDILNFLRSL